MMQLKTAPDTKSFGWNFWEKSGKQPQIEFRVLIAAIQICEKLGNFLATKYVNIMSLWIKVKDWLHDVELQK